MLVPTGVATAQSTDRVEADQARDDSSEMAYEQVAQLGGILLGSDEGDDRSAVVAHHGASGRRRSGGIRDGGTHGPDTQDIP